MALRFNEIIQNKSPNLITNVVLFLLRDGIRAKVQSLQEVLEKNYRLNVSVFSDTELSCGTPSTSYFLMLGASPTFSKKTLPVQKCIWYANHGLVAIVRHIKKILIIQGYSFE